MLKSSLAAAAGAGVLLLSSGSGHAERAVPIPAPRVDVPRTGALQTAVFAGGCFWGVEAVFENVRGVRSVTSGYAGGSAGTATYAQVSSERTRHAEAVRIVYDPRQLSYGQLMRIYFSVAHDPTQLNRQGPDTGPSYRSAIFPQNAAQRRAAAAYIAQLSEANAFPSRIVTRIESGNFYEAEAHHQDFYRRNPNHPYIVRWDKPKVAAFRAAYPDLAR
ncbi:peptide-methionine (S)-S-oxide reductase MsrA [Sphingosinithalassobacter sp. CS137]|uniref:peptide-methionine (S)-S-oxide reductase MsrA n=1 Tax=Sphingosinithalassobacter sp. CS137 TaxID=2762748 RepID=UPI00165E0989|nr:peptide-methionine (S)-S-oxide reductase MsrA [Sphingosinithalassobacter sp. CS137]